MVLTLTCTITCTHALSLNPYQATCIIGRTVDTPADQSNPSLVFAVDANNHAVSGTLFSNYLQVFTYRIVN